MKKKHKFFAKFLCLLPIAMVSSIAPCLFSCDIPSPIQPTNKFKVSISHHETIIQDSTFTISFSIDSSRQMKFVDVSLLNEVTKRVHISNPHVSLNNNTGKIICFIDGILQENENFNFNLCFQDEEDSDICDYVYDLHYVYLSIPTREFDLITITKKRDSQTSHYFTFKLNFNTMPTSEYLELSVIDTYDGLITLMNYKPKIVQSPDGQIYCEIQARLNLGVCQTASVNFGLNIEFINSFGKWQNQSFHNFVATFIKVRQDEVPKDYFLIEGDTLLGIEPDVNNIDLEGYSIFRVPADVRKIDIHNSTWGEKFYKHCAPFLKSIIFNGKEEKINDKAFQHCSNLFEIDLVSYNGLPKWNNAIFDSDHIRDFGYIWTNNIPNESLGDFAVGIGLKNHWNNFDDNSVSRDSFFVMDQSGCVTGITKFGISHLKETRVIRIPKDAVSINNDAFIDLKKNPYKDENGNIKTRRLIIDGNLESIGQSSIENDGVFSHAGISGPIFVNAPYLTEIGSSVFFSCNEYTSIDPDTVKKEDIYFEWRLDGIEHVGSYAFYRIPFLPVNISTYPLVIPETITAIDYGAFMYNKFSSIKFTNKDISLQDFCFSNPDTSMHNGTINTIDLSIYNSPLQDGDPNCIPDWLTSSFGIFSGACQSSGILILTQQIKKQVEDETPSGDDKQEHLKDWEHLTKYKLGISNDWTVEYR